MAPTLVVLMRLAVGPAMADGDPTGQQRGAPVIRLERSSPLLAPVALSPVLVRPSIALLRCSRSQEAPMALPSARAPAASRLLPSPALRQPDSDCGSAVAVVVAPLGEERPIEVLTRKLSRPHRSGLLVSLSTRVLTFLAEVAAARVASPVRWRSVTVAS